eukprot:358951-Chlamydomonas_euryale.AAC.14
MSRGSRRTRQQIRETGRDRTRCERQTSRSCWSRSANALPINPSTFRVVRSRTTRSAMVRVPGRCSRTAGG